MAARGSQSNKSHMPNRPESNELVGVDETIDAIAREALEQARRIEGAERYGNNPGPVVPPHTPIIAP